ncbi:MAG TPA: BON domain-containing protein [Planctomycetaceae bacterium]|nr:BON domain-containing protein [Planctomycetaceae bacterium]
MTRDEALCLKIREALSRNDRVAAQSIDVHAQSGIVTLGGCLPSQKDILAAVQIAASFPTCRGVVNRQVLSEPRGVHYDSLWALSAGDGLPGRSGWALLPNDGLPASLYDCEAVSGAA